MPKGHGNRIVKPRSKKQQAHAKVWGKTGTIQPVKTQETTPTRSWWVEPKSRQDFDQAVATEQSRMAASSFGKVYAAPVES